MSRRGNPQRQGQASMVSMALYSAIIVIGISTIVVVGTPILENMRDSQAIDAAKDTLTGLEEQVRDVANAGEGSSTTVGLRFARGDLVFDAGADTITYELETDSAVIGPHTSQQVGNLRISSMADVSVTESTVNGQPCWKLENQYVSACIRKIPQNGSDMIGSNTAGYWRFNVNRGGTAYDNSSYGNDGTINGARWTDGVEGSALRFDGVDDRVDVPPADALNITDQITVSAWVNSAEPLGDTERMEWVSKRGAYVMRNDERTDRCDIGAPGPIFHVQLDDGNFHGAGFCGDTPPAANEWHHYVGVFDTDTRGVELWVDGTLVHRNTSVTGMTIEKSPDPLTFGAHVNDANHFNGTIDEVRIWDRALHRDEIAWLHTQRGMLDYIDTENLILRYYNKEQDEELGGDFRITLGDDGSTVGFTNNGTGHVTPELTGHDLGRGQVDAEVESFFGVDYSVAFKLLSGADFLQIDVDD